MPRRTELRDLRSLERRSMYSIFHPLDPNERLPREMVLENHRRMRLGIYVLDFLGLAYLPALMLAIIVLASLGLNLVIAFVIAGLLAVGLLIYAVKFRYR